MIINLFPTALHYFNLPKDERNKDFYIEEINKIKIKDKGINRSNVNSWHSSSTINILTISEFDQLKNFIANSVKTAINEMGYDKLKLVLSESWAIVSPKGAYNTKHNHCGAFLSGSYYISSPSSPIIFNDPRDTKVFIEPGIMSKYTNYNSTIASFTPKEGDLYIFPSWLQHSVPENKTENDRIIISFNFRVV